jgi:hypothetical protein
MRANHLIALPINCTQRNDAGARKHYWHRQRRAVEIRLDARPPEPDRYVHEARIDIFFGVYLGLLPGNRRIGQKPLPRPLTRFL